MKLGCVMVPAKRATPYLIAVHVTTESMCGGSLLLLLEKTCSSTLCSSIHSLIRTVVVFYRTVVDNCFIV